MTRPSRGGGGGAARLVARVRRHRMASRPAGRRSEPQRWSSHGSKGFEIAFLGLAVHADTPRLEEIAVFVAVLIPGLFMLKSIISGVREGETRRRQVGMLWDVGSFWPRWFHPLAPPGYGPIAVDGLKEELKKRHRRSLAAHSQGTLIAAVHRLPDGRGRAPRLVPHLRIPTRRPLSPRCSPPPGSTKLVAEVSRTIRGSLDQPVARRRPDRRALHRSA